MERITSFLTALTLALSMFTPALAHADSITNFEATAVAAPNGDLSIMTTTTWNGDTKDRVKWLYGIEQIVKYSCDADWKCNEDKGSTRYIYSASVKPKGWGYLLMKRLTQYEDSSWASIWVVNHENNRIELEGVTPSCQEIFWSADGKQLILAEWTNVSVHDPESGKKLATAPVGDRKAWKQIAGSPCPGYNDRGEQ